ncbi:histone-lysine N-methyltransferase SETMAR [Trichonephila clavipes]|nr:histone-lysine N-methyltransferase SETMAR [Trichonephila clavipes]
MGAALTYLEAYDRHGDSLLDRIVTGDETWVKHVDCETKLQSMQWGHTSSPKRPRKCLQTLRAVQNKRRGKLASKILFLHDNARPHMANCTQELLNSFKWEVFPYPPYSPDLAPSDLHLFPKMKNWLVTKRFEDDKELRVRVTEWLRSQAAQFYDKGISKLVHCYDKCLNLFGDYVEK